MLGGKRGFHPGVAAYLAARYGYAKQDVPHYRERVVRRFAYLRERLGSRDYFGGAKPDALDVYTATFLTPFSPISEQACPAMRPSLRVAFAAAAEELGSLVPAELEALRARMFERHLAWPIVL